MVPETRATRATLAGATPEIKAGVRRFLGERGSVVDPVTFDNADYMYAAAYNGTRYRERVRREYVPYMQPADWVREAFEAGTR